MKRAFLVLFLTIMSLMCATRLLSASADAQSSLEKDEKELEQIQDLNALREARADSTEYTLDPTSVEMVVEMDPKGYGFRTRSHHMVMSADVDLILRGRAAFRYDYRFFRFFSFGLMLAMDWSEMSLYNRFRQHLATPSPRQLAILGGVSGQWRLTEWFMRSACFLEPSLLVGHMWQTLATEKSTHWRLRPGLFGGVQTVFDSGLAVTTRVGVEFPFDFGDQNPYKEVAEPLFLLGFGFAI